MKTFSIILFLAFCLLVLISVISATEKFGAKNVKIERSLLEKLERGDKVTIILEMDKKGHKTKDILAQQGFRDRNFSNRLKRLNTVVNFLKERANGSQKNVLYFLQQRNIPASQLWLTNEVVVYNADFNIARDLIERSDVQLIREERKMDKVTDLDRDWIPDNCEKAGNPWGVKIMETDKVWNVTGNRGHGIVVAIIDTGVRSSHESLSGNYRSDYGWFDPVEKSSKPFDDLGHGTHVMGTIVGTTYGIGTAPDASWMACKAINVSNWATESWFNECAQWTLCPTDPWGQNSDCSRAPHVVNNSWRFPFEGFFDAAIAAWRAAGIIPVFALGNYGPDCGTGQYPATEVDVISVGATDIKDTVWSKSSRGPANGAIKPDLSAPGVGVCSAQNASDTSYMSISGTSMAAPHVTGLITLILAEFGENLTFDQVKGLLVPGVEPHHPGENPQFCGDKLETEYPNNQVGAGRVNSYNSIVSSLFLINA